MLELYHAEPIANSVKVLICLFEKNLDFQSHYVNLLRFEQHAPKYLAINPDGFVPTLVHDGTVIPNLRSSTNILTMHFRSRR